MCHVEPLDPRCLYLIYTDRFRQVSPTDPDLVLSLGVQTEGVSHCVLSAGLQGYSHYLGLRHTLQYSARVGLCNTGILEQLPIHYTLLIQLYIIHYLYH